MRLESLRTILRLRKSSTEAAKIALADAIAVESAIALQVSDADQRILAEARAAMSLGAGDGAVEAYARWLPIGRSDALQARGRLARATSDVASARTTLALARSAEHAIEQRLDKIVRENSIQQGRKDQSELDEVAARTSPPETSWR